MNSYNSSSFMELSSNFNTNTTLLCKNELKLPTLTYLKERGTLGMLELLHTHLGFLFPKVFICLLVIISHYPVSYILGENIPPGEYSLSVHTSV
jgi:hypothetical protein